MKLDVWINGIDSFLFGSICRSIRLNLSNRTGKDRLWITRQSLHVPNQMHTLCIHYAYIKLIIFSHNPACFYVVAMRRRLNLRKWQVKKNNVAPCFNNIKYTCLRCQEYFCIPCSVFENDETVKGWKAGTSVTHCEPCFWEVMEESEKVAGKYDSDESHKDWDLAKQEERSSKKRKSIEEDTMKRSVWKQHNHMFSFNYGTEILMMP